MNADEFQLQNDNITNSDINWIDLFGYVSCFGAEVSTDLLRHIQN